MEQKRKQFQRTEDGHLLLMSNEERNLLITDLTARLNYGVICLIERVDDFGPMHRDEKLTGFCFEDGGYVHFEVCGGLDIVFAEKIMPYLRPMSSMTEEEQKRFDDFCVIDEDAWKGNGVIGFINQAQIISEAIDFLNSHHFDYRGLIEKGLALEAPVDMYKTK